MENERIWVVQIISDKNCQDDMFYYFHSYQNAFKFELETAIEAEAAQTGLKPEDYHENCSSWKELANMWFEERKTYLIEIPDWIVLYADTFED